MSELLKLKLKWNDFHSNVSESFSLFRNEEYLHDVTLVSDDYIKVPAHKLVLSACSEYFREIFKNTQHSHPLLCLDGISSEDFRNIMDYIYNGEVQIHQEELDGFLVVAKRLKLEGLIGSKETNEDNEENANEFISSIEEPESVSKLEHPESRPVSTEPRKAKSPIRTMAIFNEINEQVNQSIEVCPDGSLKCTFCGKIISTKNKKPDMKKHVESHIEGLSYDCPICHKTFRSKNALSTHKSRTHI